MMKKSIWTIFATLTLAACNGDAVAPPTQAPSTQGYQVLIAPGGPALDATETETLHRAILGYGEVLRASHPNWKSLDAATRAYLNEHRGIAGYDRVVQSVSNRVLRSRLLQERDSGDLRSAIGYYTDILVARNHPDAVVMSQAISRLEGEWSDEKIQQAAASSIQAAEAYAGEAASMAARRISRTLRTSPTDDQVRQSVRQMDQQQTEGIEVLKSLD